MPLNRLFEALYSEEQEDDDIDVEDYELCDEDGDPLNIREIEDDVMIMLRSGKI